MHITLNQLKAFERVMRLGSFRRASEELGLTQPSVSQRIHELESALATTLFTRTGPRATPTPDAHALLGYAERMLGVVNEMHDRFGGLDPLRGRVRFGAGEAFATVGLAPLLRRLEQRYPAVQASILVGDSGELTGRLNRGELDVAIVAEPSMPAHIEQIPVGTSRLDWFAAPGFLLPEGPLEPEQLAQYHLMVNPPTARLHATVLRWFAEARATPARMSLCNNAAVTRLAILEGLVLGIVPARIMRDDVASGSAKVVRVRPHMRGHRTSICYQISQSGPALRAFIDLAREVIDELDIYEPPQPAEPAPEDATR